MSSETDETERTVVKTYVPADQKETWADHADRLDMSQSEFVRTMVQAGRRGFDPDPVEGGSDGSDPGGDALEDRVLRLLREDGALDWEDLVAALTEDVESQVDDALETLQAQDLVRYSGRDGGYVLVEGPA